MWLRSFARICMTPVIANIAMTGFAPFPAFAAWQQEAFARLTTEYETNPAMSTTNPAEIRRTMLEPSYTLKGNFDSDEFRAGLSLQIMRTSNQQLNPDRENPAAFAEWLRQMENSTAGLNARYNVTFVREADIDVTIQSPASSTRSARTVGGKWDQAFTLRTGISAEASQTHVQYSGGNFLNFSTRSASLLIHHNWSERIEPFLRFLYSDYIPFETPTYGRLQSAAAGINQTLSEQLSGTAEAGRTTTSDGDEFTHGSLSVQYTRPLSVWNISASRNAAASGLGGFILVDRAAGNMRYTLSERISTGMDLTWQHSQPTSATVLLTAQGTRKSISGWILKEIDQSWQFRTYLMHNILETDTAGLAYSNLFGITLTYTRPDF